jgi:hypothetical protein
LRLAAIFILALSIHLAFAQEAKSQIGAQEKSLVEKMRPQLMKILGEEWTIKLIGSDKSIQIEEVPMPKIPKVEDDAKSVAVYAKKADKIILKLTPEQEQKYNYAYIKEVYEATRQSKPNDDEIGKMMNVLGQGGTREGVYRSLVLDSVYGGMENWDKPVKSVTADLAVYFYGKYFGKKILKKSFEGMSVYSLKRLMTEKALEVADAYGDDRDALERWYAVMSADLATRFPQIWTNAMRKKTSALEHKIWASKVPVQHIKSELVIKIHSALNSMF